MPITLTRPSQSVFFFSVREQCEFKHRNELTKKTGHGAEVIHQVKEVGGHLLLSFLISSADLNCLIVLNEPYRNVPVLHKSASPSVS